MVVLVEVVGAFRIWRLVIVSWVIEAVLSFALLVTVPWLVM